MIESEADRHPEHSDALFQDPSTRIAIGYPAGYPDAGSASGDEPGADDEPDDDFVPRAPWRPNALTVLLAAALVAGAGFLGGVLTQKNHDSGLRSASTRAGTGFAGGTFAAGGGGLAGAAGAFGGGTTGGGSTSGVTTSTDVPVVIGSLTSQSATGLVVTNLGGTKVNVRVSARTTLTAAYGTSTVKLGSSVSVYGQKAADGTVSATSIKVTG